MAKTNLTAERLREILNYSPDTGIFTWATRTSNRIVVGKVAGYVSPRDKYAQIRVSGKLHQAHRLAWLYVFGAHPPGQIDHINGNGLDNRMANLREATDQQNKQNTPVSSRSKSGLRGVYFVESKNRWCAQITSHRRTKSLGYFPTKELAYSAYLAARASIHTFCPSVRDKQQ